MSTGSHPLDIQEFAQKLSVIRVACRGMIVILAGIAIGFSLVVYFALDGIPLAGNLLNIGGVSILAIITGLLTPVVPVVAWKVGQNRREEGIRKLVKQHPETMSTDADVEGLVEAFAGGTFLEYAICTGVGFVWAVVFHVISSPLMLVWIAFLILFLAFRFPSLARTKVWYDAAVVELARLRQANR